MVTKVKFYKMKKEIDLIQHYNKYVNYHSFLDDGLNDSLLLEIPKNISSVLDFRNSKKYIFCFRFRMWRWKISKFIT